MKKRPAVMRPGSAKAAPGPRAREAARKRSDPTKRLPGAKNAIPRSPIRKRRPGPPRRGRLVDRKYLAWLAQQPGVVLGERPITIHHVRFCGSPKDDRRTLPIEYGYHQIQEGWASIEALGKETWEELHGVDIEQSISAYQARYLAEHPGIAW